MLVFQHSERTSFLGSQATLPPRHWCFAAVLHCCTQQEVLRAATHDPSIVRQQWRVVCRGLNLSKFTCDCEVLNQQLSQQLKILQRKLICGYAFWVISLNDLCSEFYGTTFGKNFLDFMKLFNWFDGTEQLWVKGPRIKPTTSWSYSLY